MVTIKFSFPLFFCVLIVSIAFAVTASAVLSTSYPIGADFYFHLDIAKLYAVGDLAGGWNYSLANNLFPYPPLTHFLLVPGVWLGDAFLYARVLQVLFLPLTLALTMFVVYRFHSGKAAVYSGMALLGSWAFMDGAIQVRPESIDLLVYPLLLICLLSAKRWRFVGLALTSAYSHGIAGLSMVYGFAVSKLRDKSWRLPLIVGVLAVVPLLVLSVYYVEGAFTKWFTLSGANQSNPQQTLFWTDPLGFIPYYVGAGLLALPFLFKRKQCMLVKYALYGLVGVSLLMPWFWADRWLHYISLPLAIVAGVGIAELPQGKWKMLFVFLLLDIFIVYVCSFFGFSLGVLGHWAQPTD